MATVTAVACSAALPMIGSKIRPINTSLRPHVAAACSMESTSSSEQMATRLVIIASATIADFKDIVTVSCCSSSVSREVESTLGSSRLALLPSLNSALRLCVE
jgi:hypothetical protein